MVFTVLLKGKVPVHKIRTLTIGQARKVNKYTSEVTIEVSLALIKGPDKSRVGLRPNLCSTLYWWMYLIASTIWEKIDRISSSSRGFSCCARNWANVLFTFTATETTACINSTRHHNHEHIEYSLESCCMSARIFTKIKRKAKRNEIDICNKVTVSNKIIKNWWIRSKHNKRN